MTIRKSQKLAWDYRSFYKMERRKHERIDEENRVIIRLITESYDVGEHTEIFALTKDISRKGARLLTDAKFAVGTVFKTTVVLSKSKETLQFDGKVKWVRSLYNGKSYEIGVQFMDELSESVLSLIQHCDRQQNGISTTVIWV
jgi:hypothetical protein